MSSKNPKIEWSKISGKECLKFTFDENLTVDEASVAIAEWKNLFREKTDKPVSIIWDCRKMRRYEQGARVRWVEALNEMKGDIESIWLISDNLYIKFGASIMSTFTSIKINTISSNDEIVI